MLPVLSAEEIACLGTRLGAGVHRTGYAVEIGGESFCIKIARGSYGAEAQLTEIRSWESLQNVEASLRSHFCEIVAFDPEGWFVVMPLCEEADDAYCGWIDTVGRNLSIRGICSDLHPGNVMRHPDGRIVITDYGFGVDADQLSLLGSDGLVAPAPPEVRSDVWNGDCPDTAGGFNCHASFGDTGLVRCEGCGWYFAPQGCDCKGCVAHRQAAFPTDLGVLARRIADAAKRGIAAALGKAHRNPIFQCPNCGHNFFQTGHCDLDAKHDGGDHWTACK